MVVTLLGLVALYAGFVWVVGQYLDSLLVAAVGAAVVVGLQVRYGRRITLSTLDARTVSSSERPELHDRVRRVAQQAGLPAPDVALIDSDTPNALATGLRPETATVCVTTGLLATLGDDELDAVLAHELAHVRNRDVAVLTTVTALTAASALLVRNFWWFGDGGGGGDGGDGGGWLLGVVAAAAVTWLVGSLLVRAVSRYREYTADRGAVAITGDPAALASALRTVEGSTPDDDLRAGGTRALLFADPGCDGGVTATLRRMVETHPPVPSRVERLRTIQAETMAG